MTVGELKKIVGHNPFVWHNGKEELIGMITSAGDWVDLTSNIVVIPDWQNYLHTSDNAELEKNNHRLIDWFEESSSNDGTCRCEWVSVLTVGCKCGAIIPYETRKRA